ncbi:MAG: hypothetical protein ACM3VY_00250 [Candidatus Bathyarchaeota archaeon]
MTTALELITSALADIGAVAVGETLSADEANDALNVLNAMIDSWSAQHLAVYHIANVSGTLVPGQADYDIGTGASIFNTDRPIELKQAFVRRGTLDFPVNLINNNQYDRIGIKSLAAPWPRQLYYETSYPMGSLHVWPVPSEANTLFLSVDQVFSRFTDLSQQVSFPPGYEEALRTNLAVRLCPRNGRPVTPDLAELASGSKAVIKRANLTFDVADYDPAIPSGTGFANAAWILTGGF